VLSKKYLLYLFFGLLFVGIFFYYDPTGSNFFPKCPFLAFTGLKCPGCGSQRALHDLLNFRLGDAFRHHPLLVISIPYLLLGFVFEMKKEKSARMLRWRQKLFGTTAIYIVLVIVIAYWILRNL